LRLSEALSERSEFRETRKEPGNIAHNFTLWSLGAFSFGYFSLGKQRKVSRA